jgi:hypothetical protein
MMAGNDSETLLASDRRDARAGESPAPSRAAIDATALAALLLGAALVLVGCARRAEPLQPDTAVGDAPPVSVVPPPPRLWPGPVTWLVD